MDTTKGTGLCNAFQLKLLALAVMMLDHTNIILSLACEQFDRNPCIAFSCCSGSGQPKSCSTG